MSNMIEQIVYGPRTQEIANLPHEVSIALYIVGNRILGTRNYNKIGNAEGVELPDIRDVVNGCMQNNTNKVILIHNHPYYKGGCDATPSDQDLIATLYYKKELAKQGIQLFDHIIVCPEQKYFSFKMNELL